MTDKTDADRRSFLKALTGASTVAAAVAAAPIAAAIPAEAQTAKADKRRARYRESDHIKTYYRTNRY